MNPLAFLALPFTLPFALVAEIGRLADEVRELRLAIEAQESKTSRPAKKRAVRAAEPETLPDVELDLMLPGLVG